MSGFKLNKASTLAAIASLTIASSVFAAFTTNSVGRGSTGTADQD